MSDILDYIEARSPQGAERRLKAVIDLLADYPESGRPTNKGDLRRLVANPFRPGLSSTAFAMPLVILAKPAVVRW
jgi:plasmid stabilization system protein ParE